MSGWVCGTWPGYHLLIRVCAGGLSELYPGGRGGCFQEKQKDENVYRCMKSYLQTRKIVSSDFSWGAVVGLLEREEALL